ncbi:MAG: hypothetical protein ACREOH_07725 [Candidatus Entotheonellia bacterium]
MGKLAIGLYDVFTQAAMATSPVVADVYDEHIRTVQDAERLWHDICPCRCRAHADGGTVEREKSSGVL